MDEGDAAGADTSRLCHASATGLHDRRAASCNALPEAVIRGQYTDSCGYPGMNAGQQSRRL